MNSHRSFEDLECWNDARRLVGLVYESCQLFPFRKDFGLKDQIQRAGVSVMSNIAEGFAASSRREFIRFLGYSCRSATEVQSHTYIALDRSYLSREIFEQIYESAEICRRKCKNFIRYLRQADMSEQK